MVKNLWLRRFDANNEFVARREIILPSGDLAKAGDPIPKESFTARRLRQLYDARTIVAADAWAEFVTPVIATFNESKKATVVFHDEIVVVDDVADTVDEPLPDVNITETDDYVEFSTDVDFVEPQPVVTELPGLALPPPAAEPQPVEDRETLLKEATELNIKVDGRWSDTRLRAEIDKALAA